MYIKCGLGISYHLSLIHISDHRIELAEGLAADCERLLQDADAADQAQTDAAARQTEYVAAQAALDRAEEEYSTMQRQLNADRAGLLAQEMCIRDR